MRIIKNIFFTLLNLVFWAIVFEIGVWAFSHQSSKAFEWGLFLTIGSVIGLFYFTVAIWENPPEEKVHDKDTNN